MILLPWYDSGGLSSPFTFNHHKWMAVRDGYCVTQIIYDPQTPGSLMSPVVTYWIGDREYRAFCTLEQFETLLLVDDPGEAFEKTYQAIYDAR